jgi:hypothetical protein
MTNDESPASPATAVAGLSSVIPHPSSFPVWSYYSGASGPLPPILQLCRETQRLHHPQLTEIDDRWIKREGYGAVLDETANLFSGNRFYMTRSDLLRFKLLADRGGLWLDIDCLMLRPTTLHDYLTGEYQMAATRGNSYRCLSHSIAAVGGSFIAQEGFARCRQFLSRHRGQNFTWADSSDGVLESLLQFYIGPGRMAIQNRELAPCASGDDRHKIHVAKTDEHHARDWRPDMELFHICNFIYGGISDWTRERILAHRGFLGYFFRKSLGLPPDNSPVPEQPHGVSSRSVVPNPTRREDAVARRFERMIKRAMR